MCIAAAIGRSGLSPGKSSHLRPAIGICFGDFFASNGIPRAPEKMAMLSRGAYIGVEIITGFSNRGTFIRKLS